MSLLEKVLEQQHSGPVRKRKRVVQPQTDELRGRRACALTAREPITQTMKRLVGGAAQGSAECRKNTALIPRSLCFGAHPTSAECTEAARAAWGGGRCTAARGAMREQGRSKTGTASLPHVKMAPMSALGPRGDRQEHLDAVISFAGAGQRRRLFRGLDILTIKWEIYQKNVDSSSTRSSCS